MGIDKEAMDVWAFGRPRPDLSLETTQAAIRDRGPEAGPIDPKAHAEFTVRRLEEMRAKIPELIVTVNKLAQNAKSAAHPEKG